MSLTKNNAAYFEPAQPVDFQGEAVAMVKTSDSPSAQSVTLGFNAAQSQGPAQSSSQGSAYASGYGGLYTAGILGETATVMSGAASFYAPTASIVFDLALPTEWRAIPKPEAGIIVVSQASFDARFELAAAAKAEPATATSSFLAENQSFWAVGPGVSKIDIRLSRGAPPAQARIIVLQ